VRPGGSLLSLNHLRTLGGPNNAGKTRPDPFEGAGGGGSLAPIVNLEAVSPGYAPPEQQ
jgi:hypothetical protein